MVKIVIVTHGNLGKGLLEASYMLFGEQQDVAQISLTPDMNPEGLKEKVLAEIKKLGGLKEQILFFVDVFGGTPFNVASALQQENSLNRVLIAGVNIPMLVEAYGTRLAENDVFALAKHVFSVGKDSVKSLPEFKVQGQSSGEVAGGGGGFSKDDLKVQNKPGSHPDIGLIRIDSRLLHGQVAMTWTKEVEPDRIVVVSDGISQDELRKTLMEGAAPQGTKVNVIPIQKFVDIYHDPRFAKVRMLLLFETPQDLLKTLNEIGDAHKDIKSVNIGSMSHSEGKEMITNAIAVDSEDVKVLKDLGVEKGIELEIRKVPTSSKENLIELLKKKGLL